MTFNPIVKSMGHDAPIPPVAEKEAGGVELAAAQPVTSASRERLALEWLPQCALAVRKEITLDLAYRESLPLDILPSLRTLLLTENDGEVLLNLLTMAKRLGPSSGDLVSSSLSLLRHHSRSVRSEVIEWISSLPHTSAMNAALPLFVLAQGDGDEYVSLRAEDVLDKVDPYFARRLQRTLRSYPQLSVKSLENASVEEYLLFINLHPDLGERESAAWRLGSFLPQLSDEARSRTLGSILFTLEGGCVAELSLRHLLITALASEGSAASGAVPYLLRLSREPGEFERIRLCSALAAARLSSWDPKVCSEVADIYSGILKRGSGDYVSEIVKGYRQILDVADAPLQSRIMDDLECVIAYGSAQDKAGAIEALSNCSRQLDRVVRIAEEILDPKNQRELSLVATTVRTLAECADDFDDGQLGKVRSLVSSIIDRYSRVPAAIIQKLYPAAEVLRVQQIGRAFLREVAAETSKNREQSLVDLLHVLRHPGMADDMVAKALMSLRSKVDSSGPFPERAEVLSLISEAVQRMGFEAVSLPTPWWRKVLLFFLRR